jgi:hypothetical protein
MYESSSQHGELSFILAKRFTVELTGDHVDMRTLESDAGRVDLAKLASMKDAGTCGQRRWRRAEYCS